MNIFKNKKFIAMALTFVMVMTLAGLPLPAKERQGSTVEVTMADGSTFRGELLAVKSDVLLVCDRDARQGKSLNLQQVTQVMVYKRSKFLDGITIGICAGLAVSIYNLNKIDHESLMPIVEIVGSFMPLPVAVFGGGLLGALGSIPKKYSLTGESSEIIQQNLEKLKRYAREQDFEKPAAD